MQDDYYRLLVKRYLNKRSTVDELEVFAHLLEEGKLDKYLQEAMDAETFGFSETEAGKGRRGNEPQRHYLPWLKLVSAALILLFISVGFYRFLKPQRKTAGTQKLAVNDLLPGSNKAILTLANGAKINLNGAKNGMLAHQGITSINKSGGGSITYKPGRETDVSSSSAPPLFNTVTTPRGGQYKVTLPDGTQAWLNSASSIHFPAEFSGVNREVAVTGEVYFEVTKNKVKPFIVTCAGQQVTVLGTHFNVNAYPEENAVKTTLLEGSVKVTDGTEAVILKPGQQSLLYNHSISIGNIDTEEAVAWKNGLFMFNQADIKTIMNQISRWYDVDVKFSGTPPADHYRGRISRDVNASKVLKILELSGINFKIEGKTIIVK